MPFTRARLRRQFCPPTASGLISPPGNELIRAAFPASHASVFGIRCPVQPCRLYRTSNKGPMSPSQVADRQNRDQFRLGDQSPAKALALVNQHTSYGVQVRERSKSSSHSIDGTVTEAQLPGSIARPSKRKGGRKPVCSLLPTLTPRELCILTRAISADLCHG